MRWPWTKRKDANRRGRIEVRADLAAAQRKLDDAHAAEPYVHDLVRKLAILREMDALDGAQVLVLLTEWRCYRTPDFAEVARRMASGAAVVDARNVWRGEEVRHHGLLYQGIGTPSTREQA